MKKTLIAAATGALGALGSAALMSAAPAQADCEGIPIGGGKIICNIQSNGSSFAMSVSPGYNLGVLLNGTTESPELGLLDQPTTFINSIVGPGGFLDGPRAPGGPTPVDPGEAPE